MSKGVLFSIGYGSSPSAPRDKRQPGSLPGPESLVELVRRLDIDSLIDCRAAPGPATLADTKLVKGTKRRVWKSGRIIYCRGGFTRYELAELLGKRYRWDGDKLGGPGGGVEGPTPRGLDMLEDAYHRGRRLLLLCAEAHPLGCHRHHQIAVRGDIWMPSMGKPLADRKIPVLHIFGDAVVKATVLHEAAQHGTKNAEADDLADYYVKE